MYHTLKKLIAVCALLFVLNIAIVGCGKDEGPMEKAGKKIDEAIEKAGDKIEDATD